MRCVVTDALFPPLSLSLSLHVTNAFLFVVVSFHHHHHHTTSQYLSLTATCELRHTS